ncbi:MAG: M23 family metallopeptidase [Deltaproteobacteria bacterium]|nr:M23 family metallopeptidase [Deltaproteobacteria bacterium]
MFSSSLQTAPSPQRPGGVRVGAAVLLGFVVGAGLGFALGRHTAQPPTPGFTSDTQSLPVEDAGISADAGNVPDSRESEAPRAAEPPAAEAKRFAAAISGSLYATLSDSVGEPREADILSAQLSRILVWWLDMRKDVLAGDEIVFTYEPAPGPGELRIRALRYTSRKLAKTHSAYYFEAGSGPYGRYYDERGAEIELRLKDGPLEAYEQVTELMNASGRRHHGVDLKVDIGAPVRLPRRARVSRRNWKTRRNGYCLHVIYLESRVNALFLHLDEVLPVARPGRVLAAGTIVARTGNTGRSTAPHLHYELRKPNGRQLNPFDFHETERLALEGADLARFQSQRERLERELGGVH